METRLFKKKPLGFTAGQYYYCDCRTLLWKDWTAELSRLCEEVSAEIEQLGYDLFSAPVPAKAENILKALKEDDRHSVEKYKKMLGTWKDYAESQNYASCVVQAENYRETLDSIMQYTSRWKEVRKRYSA